MNFLPLPDHAARQAIDSAAIFLEWLRASADASRFAGSMYFKREGDYEYLVKTLPGKRQQRLGPRSPETEAACIAYNDSRHNALQRSQSLHDALREAERLNKALKVGRAPNVVVAVLNELEAAGLGQHFTVVGTHALYAYEMAASVRIEAGALATQDVDLMWDARKRVQFVGTMEKLDSSMLKLLQRADPSFQRMDTQLESAINDKGFMVDFLRRMAVDGDPHPFRFTDDEDDIWPVQAQRADTFLSTPRFEQPIVSVTGRMALMRTIAPQVFVDFKRWLAELDTRPAGKRRRDKRQADIVQRLLDEGLLLG
jgi:Nucleotidyltransferase